MDYAVVTSLLGVVEQQLLQQPHPRFILPPHTQIILSSLKDKLRFLQAYLQQSEPKTSDPEAEKLLHKEIRFVASEAEDRIESKVGEVYLAANKGECAVEACEHLHQTLQQVVKDIEWVEVRIRDLQIRRTASSSSSPCVKLESVTDGGSSNSKYDLEHENIMIGLEDDAEHIKCLLIQTSSKQREVISIVGMPGIGKTTLAKRVYEDPSIVFHFGTRAWTVMSQQYNLRKLLIGILGCIVSLTSEISEKDDDQLAKQLRQSLIGQRYLIVIDDIWSAKAWDEFSRFLPDNSNIGSRILITSRYMAVAHFASSDKSIHCARFLNLDESWNLFSKIVCNGKCSLTPEFELIGKRIVHKCDGLPLLIGLIGGLLATLNNSPELLEDIEREFNNSSFADPSEEFYYKVEVCYNYLPSNLKACFLYLGAFSEDTEIHVKKLIKLWVAEGFLNPEMNKSLEEIAEDYLCDLINRRLVQVNKRSLDGKIKSCMLHDILHDFCLGKAHREDIMTVRNEYPNFLEGCRWINCQSHGWPITPSSYLNNNSSAKTRSILYFGENLYLAKCWLIFSSLKLLRVLDLSVTKYWHGMPSEIADLIHLRYLALTTIGSLCNFQLFKLQSLQTLILSSWMKECQLQLPRDVLDLSCLRHVHFDKGSSLYLPNVVQENLQTLLWLKVIGWDSRTTDFTRVPNLKELGINIEGEVLPNALESLAQLHQLEKLKFEMGRVERFNLPTSFPPNLKQLTLSNTYLSWEEMDNIAKLPNLELLKLKDFAFCGPEWKPTDGGFQQLKFFLIERSDLEHWKANAHHFPVLECLILRYCWDLEKLPNDFVEIYTLRLIELNNCCSSLMTTAKEIQQGQRDLGYEALVVRDVTKVELPSNESLEKRSESAI